MGCEYHTAYSSKLLQIDQYYQNRVKIIVSLVVDLNFEMYYYYYKYLFWLYYYYYQQLKLSLVIILKYIWGKYSGRLINVNANSKRIYFAVNRHF